MAAAILRKVFQGGLAAIACASALSLFERADWRIELLAHWRIHYIAGAILLGVGLALLRRSRSVVIAAVLVAVNAFFIQTSYGSGAASGSLKDRAEHLRVVSFNVDYGNHAYSRALAWLRRCDADVLVFQELSREWLRRLRPLAEQYPQRALTLGFRDGDGIAVFSRLPITEWRVLRPGEGFRLAVAAVIRHGDRTVTVIGAHPMNPMSAERARQRERYLTALTRLAASVDGPTIVAGDFNATPWSYLYRDFLRGSGMVRQGRIAATWPAPLGLIGIPIDHVFAGPEFVAAEAHTGPNLGSDHYPLVVDLYRRI